MSLHGKIAAWLVALSALAAAPVAVVTHRAMDRVLLDLKREHFRFVVNDVRTTVNNLTVLGLPLPALRRIQDILERARRRDPEIGAVFVYDTSGKIIYSTDLGEIGTALPEQPGDGGATSADDGIMLTASLTNSFGSVAGGVALRYNGRHLERQREDAWILLGAAAIAGLMAAGVGALIGARAALADLYRGIEAAVADLQALLSGGAAQPLPDDPHWLRAGHAAYADRGRRILRQVDDLEAEVAHLDETG